MRYSILHQSQLSVPPAPAFNFRIALFLSYSPDRRVLILILSNVSLKEASSSSISGIIAGSLSSYPSSISVRISSYWPESPSIVSTTSFNCFASRTFALERSGLSQKSGACISISSSSIRLALSAKLK